MKTNRNDSHTHGTSPYARKVQGRRMMYGNGKTCCGHRHVPGILARMNEESLVTEPSHDDVS
jgi:hypothetical protein